MHEFDDSRLDDPSALATVEPWLRYLAQSGARMRIEWGQADLSGLAGMQRPRAVIASGPEARLIRALLEPTCPVPFVAWPTHGLPGWVGPLDLCLVLTGETFAPEVSQTIAEASRRGAEVLVACPEGSAIAEQAAGPSVTIVPTRTHDPLAAAIVVLSALHLMGLGPAVLPERVADAMDIVAEESSPHVEGTANPAKDAAMCLGDDLPLIWGGSVLAARASRRIAEAIRERTGRAALAADVEDLLPVIAAARPRDLFADPFEQPVLDRRPVLVIIDDESGDAVVAEQDRRLRLLAERHEVRVCTIAHRQGSETERYGCVLQRGLYVAAYLALGLGLPVTDDPEDLRV